MHGHTLPNGFHVKHSANCIEIFAPNGHSGARNFDVGIRQILFYIFSVGAIVRHCTPHGAGPSVRFDISLECLARNGMWVVAPVGEKVMQPFSFFSADQCFWQIWYEMEQKEPVSTRCLSAHILRDYPRRDIIHNDQPIYSIWVVFGKACRHASAAIVPDEGNLSKVELVE